MNDIFYALFVEQVEIFKSSFLTTSRKVFYDEKSNSIFHNGEFGKYRETIVKEFLRFVIPRNLDISSGFVITSKNRKSTQCDIIIFDKTVTPLYHDGERQCFFPIESICGIGEVKSTLTKVDFIKTINKLADNKSLSADEDRKTIIRSKASFELHNVFSFLICKKLNFNISNLHNEINDLYRNDIDKKYKHNIILSIEDGIILYCGANEGGIRPDQSMPLPIWVGKELKNRIVIPGDHEFIHFQFFCSYIFMLASTKAIYYPEFNDYVRPTLGGFNYDQN